MYSGRNIEEQRKKFFRRKEQGSKRENEKNPADPDKYF